MPVHVPRFDGEAVLPVGPEVPVGMLVFHGDVQKRWDGAAWQEASSGRDAALYATGARQVVRTWQLESAAFGVVERFEGWTGEAFLNGQDDVASVAGDVVVTRGASLGDGALSITVADPLEGVNIGDPFMDGYFVGIIDTTRDNIIAEDASQVGLRYALIVAPVSLENAAIPWRTPAEDWAAPAATRTRWDGLSATQAMNTEEYPAAQYCAGLSYPDDGGSPWYLGAMDEIEVLYRNLKPTAEANYVWTLTGHEFPGGGQDIGYNPSSDPFGLAYTSVVPDQTSALVFQDGGSQELGTAGTYASYWSSTEYDAASNAWYQYFSSPSAGQQYRGLKTNSNRVRPVRRLVL